MIKLVTTAKLREAGGLLDREETRIFFVLMFLCLVQNRELREWGRINSRIRKFVIIIVTTAKLREAGGLLDREETRNFCSYVFFNRE